MTGNTPEKPLNSYDAEFKLLSIFCQYKEALGYLSDKIIPEYFTDTNKLLFKAIFDLYQSGLCIDFITIVHNLKKIPNGERANDHMVTALFQPVAYDKIEAYLSIVAENYKTRNYQSMIIEINKAMTDKKSSSILAEIVAKYTTNVDLGLTRPKSIEVITENYEKELEETIINGNTYDKLLLKFYIDELDRHDMMRPGNIYTFGARPSQGKTSAMLQSAYGNAFVERKRVCIFSLEMTEFELLEKLYCRHYGIDSSTWLKMPPDKKLKEIRAFKAFQIANKIDLIIDTECENINAIVNRATVINSQKKIDLICIDYIQLVDSGLINRTTAEEIEHIMKTIKKKLAMKLKTVVIALSQMNKKLEQEGYRMPILADLLNGGAIEAASTSVYFLHSVSPMVRKYFDDEGQLENKGETLFVAQKARFGQKGILKLWFAGGVNIFVKDFDEYERIKSEVAQKCQHYLTN